MSALLLTVRSGDTSAIGAALVPPDGATAPIRRRLFRPFKKGVIPILVYFLRKIGDESCSRQRLVAGEESTSDADAARAGMTGAFISKGLSQSFQDARRATRRKLLRIEASSCRRQRSSMAPKHRADLTAPLSGHKQGPCVRIRKVPARLAGVALDVASLIAAVCVLLATGDVSAR